MAPLLQYAHDVYHTGDADVSDDSDAGDSSDDDAASVSANAAQAAQLVSWRNVKNIFDPDSAPSVGEEESDDGDEASRSLGKVFDALAEAEALHSTQHWQQHAAPSANAALVPQCTAEMVQLDGANPQRTPRVLEHAARIESQVRHAARVSVARVWKRHVRAHARAKRRVAFSEKGRGGGGVSEPASRIASRWCVRANRCVTGCARCAAWGRN